MRDQDKREISAVVAFDNAAQVAAWSLHNSGEDCFIAYLDGEPVAAIGVTPIFEGLGSGWAFGTNRMRRVVPALTRFTVKQWIPQLKTRYRRVEVRSIADHDLSHRWLTGMGYEFEGVAKGYGRNGEDFNTYAFVRGHVSH